MRPISKSLAVAAVIAVVALAVLPAHAARVAVGIGVGVPFGGYYGPGYWGPGFWGPYEYGARYVYYPPPPVVVPAAPEQALPNAPDPIFYPKQGQSAAQTETDRQDCNRWAAAQPSALADATVFQRATYACMEGRGYTVK